MNTLLLLTLSGILVMLSEIVGFKKGFRAISLFGLLAAFVLNILDWNINQSLFNDMVMIDNYAVAFSGLLIAVVFMWFLLFPSFVEDENHKSDRYSTLIFALAGSILMTNYSNLIMLFLGIEILSIAMYLMSGSRKSDISSNEAAFKYFLMGAFATGFLLFGFALVYGATGSFNLISIAEFLKEGSSSSMLSVGVLLILVAMAFKVSVVPFHFWAPDVYQGAPTPITAFMSTIVKGAAFAGFLRLFFSCFSSVSTLWENTLWVMCAITILIGNITAVYQKNIKRMLAYSSVAHAGYMLMSILALNQFSQGSLFYYAAAYGLSSLAAFAILTKISRSGDEGVDFFKGLAFKSPILAFVTMISVLSLAGIPPLAGFFAKYYIFSAALQEGYPVLVLIAVIGSLVGVYYYFRLVIAMFSSEHTNTEKVTISFPEKSVLLLISIASLLLGIMPGFFVELL